MEDFSVRFTHKNLNGYARFGGTSMATPLQLVCWSYAKRKSITFFSNSKLFTNSGVDINQNIGPRIDAYQALLCVLPE